MPLTSIPVTYLGTPHFVNVDTFMGPNPDLGTAVQLYLSSSANTTNYQDNIGQFNAYPSTAAYYQALLMNTGCTYKKTIDDTTTVVGCLNLAAAVFCGVITLDTGGVAYITCSAEFVAGVAAGATCLRGVAGMIVDQWVKDTFESDNYAASFFAKTMIDEVTLTSLLSHVADVACNPDLNPRLNPPPPSPLPPNPPAPPRPPNPPAPPRPPTPPPPSFPSFPLPPSPPPPIILEDDDDD